jgi:transcription factor E2F7/8
MRQVRAHLFLYHSHLTFFIRYSFLRLFSNEQETWGGVCLDSAAKKLHVERRRIYDIVNVLESVEIVARRAKNKYAWFGMTRLPQAIERLRTATLAELNTEPAERQAAEAELDARAASQGIRSTESDKSEGVAKETLNPSSHDVVGHSTALESAGLSAPSVVEVEGRNVMHLNPTNGSPQNSAEPCSTEDEAELAKLAPPMIAVASSASGATAALPSATQEEDLIYGVTRDTYNQFLEMYRMAKASRKEKSLGVLSQKFVQLFLNSEHGVVSLEPAARKLLEEDTFNDESQLKTKIRRLYDIANILCSLNLVLPFFVCFYLSIDPFFFAD